MLKNDTDWLEKAVSEDEIYQQMLREAEVLEPEFERILRALPEGDQTLLEKYISLSEEMEYRRTILALERKKTPSGEGVTRNPDLLQSK